MIGKDSSWEGFYTHNKGCNSHKDLAKQWAGSPGAHMRFYLLERGINEDSIDYILEKSYILNAMREVTGTQYHNGKVLTAKQANMSTMFKKIENSWLDVDRIMSRKKRLEYKEDLKRKEDVKESELNTGDAGAFNFRDDLSKTTINPMGDSSTVLTQTDRAIIGGTK